VSESVSSEFGSEEPLVRESVAGSNPFGADVCTGPYGVTEAHSVAALNAEVLDRLRLSVDEQQERTGRVVGQPLVLLTAPRAGYGKTHLLGRMTAASGGQWLLLPLAFRMGDEVTRANVGRRGLEALSRAETEVVGWSKLREAAGGVVAALLKQLIQLGKLPCANPEQAVRVLSGPVQEIFSASGQAHLIGEWLRKHVAPLRKPMAELASRSTGAVTIAEAEVWLQALISHALEGEGAGMAALLQVATQSEEGCGILMKMLGLWRPVVLLVDHLDGFYRNADAGLRIATLLLDLAELDGHPVVLSLNQDVWQATFGHHLPSALEDRLTASRLLLRGLTEEEAADLVKLRLRDAGVEQREARVFEDFLDVPRYFMGRPVGSVSARVFLRHAAQQWVAFTHSVPAGAGAPQGSGGFLDEDERLPSGASLGLLPLIQGRNPSPPSPSPSDSPFKLSDATIFDSDTNAMVKQVAGGLAEPDAALPQNEVPESLFDLETGTPEDAVESLLEDDAPEQGPPEVAAVVARDPAVTRVPGSFEKLREMLEKLRQTNGMGAVVQGTKEAAARASVAQLTAPVATDPVVVSPSGESVARAALMGRFEALKLQMKGEAESRPLDGTRVMELIRLAGRRFPLVRPAEHELAGLPELPVMGWTLRGAEILFAPPAVVDPGFWKALGVFAAGRATTVRELAENTGEPKPDFKVVVFKSVGENSSWGALFSGPHFPEALKPWIDVVHLDGRSLAALYAMQRIIREAEMGTLQAAPQQVMSVLARELDFFWKRVTRPLATAK
jgi:hypothetical protein